MISTSDFEKLFLDGLIDKTLFYDKSIYHLDGPGALRHLETIYLHCIDISEVDMLIDNLSPEGVFLRNITGIDSKETAQKLLNKLYTEWK